MTLILQNPSGFCINWVLLKNLDRHCQRQIKSKVPSKLPSDILKKGLTCKDKQTHPLNIIIFIALFLDLISNPPFIVIFAIIFLQINF